MKCSYGLRLVKPVGHADEGADFSIPCRWVHVAWNVGRLEQHPVMVNVFGVPVRSVD